MTSSQIAISLASAATAVGWATGWSFSAAWLNAVWMLLLAAGWGYEAWRSNWRWLQWISIVIVFLAVTDLVAIATRPLDVHLQQEFADGYVVKERFLPGFLDAGTAYYVYKRSKWLRFFEEYQGDVAYNFSKHHVNMKNALEVTFTPRFLVFKMAGHLQPDTLLIQEEDPGW
jgi:hypothetical protein